VEIDINAVMRGPMLDGSAPKLIRQFEDEARRDIAEQGRTDVRQILGQKLQNATGHYERQIITTERPGATVVHDQGVIYGPWLEGTARRNARSRFKGYSAFRKAKQELERKVPQLLDAAVRRLVGRLG